MPLAGEQGFEASGMAQAGADGGLYSALFGSAWPYWVGALVVGVLDVLLLLVGSPLGITSGYNNIGRSLYQIIGWSGSGAPSPLVTHPFTVLNITIFVGALAAALLARGFAVQVPPALEAVKGVVGGALMALGASIGLGCTIGAFFSGWAALSAGGICFGIGLLVGSALAVRYLLWEMERAPVLSTRPGRILPLGRSRSWQPAAGAFLAVVTLAGGSILYADNKALTWFCILGLLIGVACQRSQFCVVRAFREPFMTGESSPSVGLLAGLAIAALGFTLIKYMGVGASGYADARELALTGVYSHFWLRASIGGLFFGVGMTIAGGCALGSLWRAAEGQVKLMLAALSFILAAPLCKQFVVNPLRSSLPEWAEQRLFLPDIYGYGGALLFSGALLFLWYAFVRWNERTGRFSAI